MVDTYLAVKSSVYGWSDMKFISLLDFLPLLVEELLNNCATDMVPDDDLVGSNNEMEHDDLTLDKEFFGDGRAPRASGDSKLAKENAC